MTMKPLFLIVMSVCLGVAGQVLLKKGMMDHGRIESFKVSSIVEAFFQFKVIVAFSCYAVSSVIWMVVLSRVNLSYAYPLLSMSYIFILILSMFFLGETVQLMRWGGVLLICVGVVLVSQGS